MYKPLTVRHLNQSPQHTFKTVTAINNGRATIVSDDNNANVLKVTHHSNIVDTLEIGDKVCVQITDKEVVVEYRLIPIQDISERSVTTKNLAFSASESLILQCGNSTLKLSPDGIIYIAGIQLKMLGNRSVLIEGARIDLQKQEQ